MKYWTFVFYCWVCCSGAFAAACRNGYDVLSSGLNDGTFIATFKGTCPSGYHVRRHEYQDFYTVIDNTACGSGERLVNGVCVAYDTGSCKQGYVDLAVTESTVISPYKGTCSSGYHIFPYDYSDLYTTMLGTAHCGAGYHPGPNNTCVAWDQGECPSGQIDYFTSSTFAYVPLFTQCASGYSKYNVSFRTCGDGTLRTYMDTCAPACSVAKSLHVSDFEIPLYATKNTQPSLAVMYNSEICYVDMAPDTAGHTINVNYSGGTYHAEE